MKSMGLTTEDNVNEIQGFENLGTPVNESKGLTTHMALQIKSKCLATQDTCKLNPRI